MLRHGTSTAYLTHACRCEPCRTSHARHQKAYRLDRHRGIARLVDAQPLRDHVAALTAAGLSPWDITIAAGWKSRNALADAMRRDKVTPRTMARILAITEPPVTRRNGYVDATGSRRRLQGLAAIGWPSREIARRLGHHDAQTYQCIANGSNRTIRRRTEHAITRLYDELWDQQGPSAKTRAIAARKGWAVPLAWDDDTIDDPAAQPHADPATGRTSGRRSEHVIEDFLDTMDHHQGDIRLAAMRLGVGWSGLTQALVRARRAGADLPMLRNGYRSGVAA